MNFGTEFAFRASFIVTKQSTRAGVVAGTHCCNIVGKVVWHHIVATVGTETGYGRFGTHCGNYGNRPLLA